MSSPPSSPSGAMLQAALGGLLCFAACGDPDASSTGGSGGSLPGRTSANPSTSVGSTSVAGTGGGSASESGSGGGSASGSGGDGSASGSGGDGSASGSGGDGSATASTGESTSSSDASASSSTGTNPHTPIPNTECEDGQVPDPVVTSSEIIVLTDEQFAAICSEAGGILEVQPLCGGSNACRGIAYDTGTHVLTHHTCKATNTCAGFNCVVCDDA